MKRIDLKGGVFIPLLLALAPTPSAQAGPATFRAFVIDDTAVTAVSVTDVLDQSAARPVSTISSEELAENRANSGLSGSSRLDEIAARGVLRVGLSGDYEPFSIEC
jgi:hypothetical protein